MMRLSYENGFFCKERLIFEDVEEGCDYKKIKRG